MAARGLGASAEAVALAGPANLPMDQRQAGKLDLVPVEAGDQFPVSFWAGLFLELGPPLLRSKGVSCDQLRSASR